MHEHVQTPLYTNLHRSFGSNHLHAFEPCWLLTGCSGQDLNHVTVTVTAFAASPATIPHSAQTHHFHMLVHHFCHNHIWFPLQGAMLLNRIRSRWPGLTEALQMCLCSETCGNSCPGPCWSPIITHCAVPNWHSLCGSAQCMPWS